MQWIVYEMKRLIVSALLLLGCSGCALIKSTIDIPYQPVAAATVVPGASTTTVALSATDIRATFRDRVGTKKNGYGMEMAAIVPAVDPSTSLTEAFDQELRARGFRIGPGGASVKIELIRFYNDHKIGFFTADAVANVAFNVKVTGQDGKSSFSKYYEGDGTEANNLVVGADNARAALIKAFAAGINSAVSDPDFIQAVLAAGGRKLA